MLDAAIEKDIPLLLGSAGGGGGEPQITLVREVLEELAKERGYHFKYAVIHSEQTKDTLKAANRAGRIQPLGPIAELDDETIDQTHRCVAMMGVEPFQKALNDGARSSSPGRATDASIYSAIPLMHGYDPGLVWHMAKIIECAGQVVTPRPGSDSVVGTLHRDHFLVEPPIPTSAAPACDRSPHALREPEPLSPRRTRRHARDSGFQIRAARRRASSRYPAAGSNRPTATPSSSKASAKAATAPCSSPASATRS